MSNESPLASAPPAEPDERPAEGPRDHAPRPNLYTRFGEAPLPESEVEAAAEGRIPPTGAEGVERDGEITDKLLRTRPVGWADVHPGQVGDGLARLAGRAPERAVEICSTILDGTHPAVGRDTPLPECFRNPLGVTLPALLLLTRWAPTQATRQAAEDTLGRAARRYPTEVSECLQPLVTLLDGENGELRKRLQQYQNVGNLTSMSIPDPEGPAPTSPQTSDPVREAVNDLLAPTARQLEGYARAELARRTVSKSHGLAADDPGAKLLAVLELKSGAKPAAVRTAVREALHIPLDVFTAAFNGWLAAQTPTTYAEKLELADTVRLLTHGIGVQMLYNNHPCYLTTARSADHQAGRFRVVKSGSSTVLGAKTSLADLGSFSFLEGGLELEGKQWQQQAEKSRYKSSRKKN